jgi:hypothetical protein
MLIIDDYSRLTWVAFLKEKSEAFEKFKVFKAFTENQTRKRLKAVRFDRGGEFSSWNFKEFCDKHGIKRVKFTCNSESHSPGGWLRP